MDQVFGVIDIGSNTVHLLVATSGGKSLRPIDDLSVHLRLGVDLELDGAISELKVRATAETVRTFVERAEARGVREVSLLATQAVRAARNRDGVVLAIERATGVPVTVLEPEREAYFALLGAALTGSPPAPHLVADVGGASTQLLIASAESMHASVSAPVGSGRLATRFSGDPPDGAELRAVRARIKAALRPALGALAAPRVPGGTAVVVGGAMRRLARVISPRGAPLTVSAEEVGAATRLLLRQRAKAIARRRGIEVDRVQMMRAGALIIEQLLRLAGLASCTISPYGIREGAILDAARKAASAADAAAAQGGRAAW